MSITHSFTSGKSDGGDATLVRPSDWNAAHAGTDGYTNIVSTGNEDATNVSGATQDHTELQFSTVAGKHYLIRMQLMISGSDTTGDFAYRFAVAAGTMDGRGSGTNLSSSLVGEVTGCAASAAANTGSVTVGTPADVTFPESITMNFAFEASNTTTFKLQFGNASAGVGRISRVWAGSILSWKQVD